MIRKNKSHDDEDCSQSKKHRSTVESVSVYHDDQSSTVSTSDRTIPTQTSQSESNQSSPIRHNHNQQPYLEIEETPPAFQSSTRSSIHSVNNASQSCNLNELGNPHPSSSTNKQNQQQPPKSSVASAWNRLGRSWGWFVSAD